MIDILFVLTFLIFPVIVIFLLKLTNVNIFSISIPSFLIISMFLFAYLGFLPLYFGWSKYAYSIGVQNQDLILKGFFLSVSTIFSLLIGYLFSYKILNLKLKPITNLRSLSQKEKGVVFFTIILCYIVLNFYLEKISNISFLLAFSGDSNQIAMSRELMGNDFEKYHRYRWFMRDLFTIVTLAIFANWLIMKKTKDLFIFFIALIGLSFSLVMATEKAPFAWFLVSLFCVYCIVKKNSIIHIKPLIVVTLALFSSLIIFYLFFMNSENIFSAFTSLLSRVFMGGINPSYFYLEYFPNYHDFLFGKSFPNVAGIFPFEPYQLTREIYKYMFSNFTISGSAPTVFWGELYANFGYYGVVIIPFFLGILIYIISYIFNKLENTPLKIGLFVWLLMHYRELAVTGISGFLIDITLLVMVFFVFLIILFSNNLKIKYYKK